MKLALVGDTRHSVDAQGRLGSLSPVVRQLRPWLERFEEVIWCAPLLPGPPPAHHEPYHRQDLRFVRLPAGGGVTPGSKVRLAALAVQWWPVLRQVLRTCDVVHFRCPCNIALIGLLAMRGLRVRRFAMYAGNWAGYPGESPFYRLQRRMLNSASFGGVAAVYGTWPRQPRHVVTSFSPSFTLAEWEAETAAVQQKLLEVARAGGARPLRVASVGHLNADKNHACLLRAISHLRRQAIPVQVEVLGDGPERERLERMRDTLGLRSCVTLRGRVSLETVRAVFRQAHTGVLGSLSEGFPKVLGEAMAGGAVPVASEVGINAEILGRGARGLLFPFDDAEALAGRLRELTHDPALLARLANAGRAYARTITLDAFEDLQHRILTERLGVPERRGSRWEAAA